MNVAILLFESLWKCEIEIEKWDLTLKFHVAAWLATSKHARAQVYRIYEQLWATSRNAAIKSFLKLFADDRLMQDDLYNKTNVVVAGRYTRCRGGRSM